MHRLPSPPRVLISSLFASLVALSSCGGTPPTEKAEIVIASAPSAPVGSLPLPTRSRTVARDGGFDACLDKLRAGSLDSAANQERTPAAERDRYVSALANEREGKLLEARRGYLEIIQKFPQSRLVPLVYLAFGELFLKTSTGDPTQLPLAEQSYREVLKYPPPDNAAYGFASMRLGQIFRAGHRPDQALSSSMKAVDVARTSAEPCEQAFADVARSDLVDAYAEMGKPEAAFAFFQRVGDPNRKGSSSADLVERLLVRYVATDQAAEALALIEDNAKRSPSTSFCAAAHAALELLRGSKGAVARDIAARESSLAAHCGSPP